MNILRYKQKAQGWMPRDDGGGEGTTTPTETTTPTDATAWGGKESGFDPSTPGIDNQYKGNFEGSGWSGSTTGETLAPGVTGNVNTQVASSPDQFSRLQELSDMFKTNQQLPGATNSLNQLSNLNFGGYTTGSDMNAQNQDQAQADQARFQEQNTPTWAARMGIIPGMSKEAYFNQLSPSANAERMGMINTGIGAVGNALVGAALPAPVRMALGAYNAYQGYQNDPNKDLGKAVATGLSGVSGYTGALANMYNGNYGAAVTGGLAMSGITGPLGTMAGLGTDYATGKDVAPSLGGLAGQFAGNAIGGPIGGMFGKSLGQQMGRSGSIRK